jgi:5-methylcytosine-specific restriction enzyme A
MAKAFAKKFYNSKSWIKTRESYIASVHGLCEGCLEKGKLRPGYIVHHKKEITPENVTDSYITLNFNNLQYLCLDCHNKIHLHDGSVLPNDLQFDINGDLVESKSGGHMKVVVVHGAMLSGKTTYVRDRITKDDIVFDYDEIAKALTYGHATKGTKLLIHDYIMDFRRLIIERIKNETSIKTLYFITTNVTNELKHFLFKLNPTYIYMDVSEEECLRRLYADNSRENNEMWERIIREWFDNNS